MKRLGLLLVAALALTGFGAGVKPVESGTHFAKDALNPFVERGELPGVINVFYKNGVQETCVLGYSDVEKKRPITMDDIFMQCSQTKGFCGVTIAMLVEEGKISIDDPVAKYLPEFGELWYYDGMTNGVKIVRKAKNVMKIRNVMNHTAGFLFELPSTTSIGGWSHRMPLRSVAAMAAALPLQYDPGTNVRYSNVGIDVGAAIVEVVTGQRWEDFVQKRIFDPLEMKSSSFKPTDAQLEKRICLYRFAPGKPAEPAAFSPSMAPPYNDDRTFASAGAGIWTTANDQLKFYKMLMNLGIGDNGVRILKEETVKSILAVSTRPTGMTIEGKPFYGYSLGLDAPVKDAEDSWFGHGGAWRTNCYVNWHRKELNMIVVQILGDSSAYSAPRQQAGKEFFNYDTNRRNLDGYTGRMK